MLHALVRSSLVLTGLLLLAVGIGNVVAGARKIACLLYTLTLPTIYSV